MGFIERTRCGPHGALVLEGIRNGHIADLTEHNAVSMERSLVNSRRMWRWNTIASSCPQACVHKTLRPQPRRRTLGPKKFLDGCDCFALKDGCFRVFYFDAGERWTWGWAESLVVGKNPVENIFWRCWMALRRTRLNQRLSVNFQKGKVFKNNWTSYRMPNMIRHWHSVKLFP